MNNFFNINRFWRLFVKDFKSLMNNLLPIFSSGMIVYLSVWIVAILFDISINSASNRLLLIMFIFFITILVAPSKLYPSISDKSGGAFFALLPASTFEKLISILLNTAIILPVLFFIFAFAFDFVLSILPFERGFDGSIIETLLNSDKYFSDYLFFILTTILIQSTYIYGNVKFSTHKFAKSTLIIFVLNAMIIAIAFAIMYYVFGSTSLHFEDGGIIKMNNADIDIDVANVVAKTIQYVYYIVLPLLFYYLTYRTIKTKRY